MNPFQCFLHAHTLEAELLARVEDFRPLRMALVILRHSYRRGKPVAFLPNGSEFEKVGIRIDKVPEIREQLRALGIIQFNEAEGTYTILADAAKWVCRLRPLAAKSREIDQLSLELRSARELDEAIAELHLIFLSAPPNGKALLKENLRQKPGGCQAFGGCQASEGEAAGTTLTRGQATDCLASHFLSSDGETTQAPDGAPIEPNGKPAPDGALEPDGSRDWLAALRDSIAHPEKSPRATRRRGRQWGTSTPSRRGK